MKIHHLKTWPKYFKAIQSGEKTFEVRENDRDYKVGDILHLEEYDPHADSYTNQFIRRKVSYVLQGGSFGISKGYCVMGLVEY